MVLRVLKQAALAALVLAAPLFAAEPSEPPLPSGLGGAAEEPVLPPGLGAEEPPLPGGLGAGQSVPESPEAARARRRLSEMLRLSGFWDTRAGIRTRNDPYEDQESLGETRLHLESERTLGEARFKLGVDFLYDWVAEDVEDVNLNRGTGFVDLREANVSYSPFSFMDLKAGRQILTWGTGDLIFINDVFPKDYVSFFIGRDVTYLKAPSDAVKVSLFSETANLDIAYTPQFDPDRFLTGERISFYNPLLGRIAGQDAVLDADVPDEWFTDDEVAARLYRNAGGYELAAYFYNGFWKSPGGFDGATGEAIFPALSVYGASALGRLGRGIGNVEVGYYDSLDDEDGDDPLISNSQLRFLAGYEQDLGAIAANFTLGLQYYLEWMQDYGDYRRALPAGAAEADEYRHVATMRLTKLLMNQNLTLSIFAFYSPSDRDAYLRPFASYKINDHWAADIGANIFTGDRDYTFFGQLEDNTNIYAALRYGF